MLAGLIGLPLLAVLGAMLLLGSIDPDRHRHALRQLAIASTGLFALFVVVAAVRFAQLIT